MQPDLADKLADAFFENCLNPFPNQVMAQPGLKHEFIYSEILIFEVFLNHFSEPSDKFLVTCIGKVHLLIFKRLGLYQIYKIMLQNERITGYCYLKFGTSVFVSQKLKVSCVPLPVPPFVPVPWVRY